MLSLHRWPSGLFCVGDGAALAAGGGFTRRLSSQPLLGLLRGPGLGECGAGGPRSPSSEERWRSAPPPPGGRHVLRACGVFLLEKGLWFPSELPRAWVALSSAWPASAPRLPPPPCSVWAAQWPPAPAPLTAVWGPALLRVAPALQGPGPGWALLRPLSLAACSEQSRRQGPPRVPGTKATGCLRPGSRATLGRYSRCRRDPPAALLSGAGARGHARAFAVSGSMNFMMQSPVCLGSSGKPHQPGVATSQGRRAGRPHHAPYPTAGVVATARCS